MKVTDKINTVHHLNFLDNSLPDKCANLIIADPPYYKVKGDFDFIWKTFEDYLKDVEKWAIECKRILADNGTLLWYGDAKNIAYAQIIFDKHFNLLSNVTCHIYDRQTNKITTEDARSFINTTERILMYEQGGQKTGGELIFEQFLKPKNPFSKYLKIEFKKANVNNKEIAKLFPSKTGGVTGCVSNWLNGDNVITEEQYLKVREYFKNDFLLKPYEELRKEYEELRRPFNPTEQYKMDVLRVSQEGHITGKYDHETVKPEKLTRILIKTCSRENDLVVIPFAGSGTECAMSVKEKREFIAYEITEKHVKISNDRVQKILKEPTLF